MSEARIAATKIANANGYNVHVGCGGEIDCRSRCHACGARTTVGETAYANDDPHDAEIAALRAKLAATEADLQAARDAHAFYVAHSDVGVLSAKLAEAEAKALPAEIVADVRSAATYLRNYALGGEAAGGRVLAFLDAQYPSQEQER